MKITLAVAATFATLLIGPGAAVPVARQAAPDLAPQVDRVFKDWTADDAGVRRRRSASRAARSLEKAYGMADLEHDVQNTPDTIFEAGSVSKQFTAAAVLLLAREGKLSLDDPVAEVHPGAAGLRRAAHHPPHAQPHQRPARLGQRRRHRRLAAHEPRATRTRTCSTSSAASARSTFRPARAIPTATPATTWRRSSSRA